MAWTTTERGRFITLTPDGSTDWDYRVNLSAPLSGPSPLCVRSINFHASGADTLVIREKSVTGSEIYRTTTTGASEGAANREGYSGNKSGQYMRPFIANADCTFNTAGNCRVTIELA